MISLTVYLIAVLLFVVVFAATRLTDSFGLVMRTSHEAMRVLGDATADDSVKERAARTAGLALLRQAVVITVKGVLAVAAAALPFWIADLLALESWEVTMAFALRWDVLVITLVAGVLIWYVLRRRSSPAT